MPRSCIESVRVRESAELEKALDAAISQQAGAVFFPTAITTAYQRRIVEFAARKRWPAMYTDRSVVEAGGLMSYSANVFEQLRRAAIYVDKILKGAKPADLPIEQATKFELVVNLKTARALGLTIPPSLLARADQVIE